MGSDVRWDWRHELLRDGWDHRYQVGHPPQAMGVAEEARVWGEAYDASRAQHAWECRPENIDKTKRQLLAEYAEREVSVEPV